MSAKPKWRLLRDGITDPNMHFAVEEALLRLTDEQQMMPTLRLRQTEPSVWIGYYQNAKEDVDISFCKQNGLKIVRRMNSGGAVYQDNGTFCYSAFFIKEQLFHQWGISKTDDLYRFFGQVVTGLCSKYGITAELSPVNDITVNGHKIYGSAQLEWYSAFMHSGSLLVDANIEMMQQVLNPGDLKFADKGVKTVRERVSNLMELTTQITGINQVMQDFIQVFADLLSVEFEESGLTAKEQALADELYREKYSKPEWTFAAPKQFTTLVSTKIAGGVLTLKCNLLNQTIQSASIGGDFLISHHEIIENLMREWQGKPVREAAKVIPQQNLPEDIAMGLTRLLHQIEEV